MSDWLRRDPQRPRGKISMRLTVISAAACALTLGTAYADDGLGLKRSGNRSDVSISGLSSGAAMALQYAVAHSGSIVGVGTIAGPAWGCADGSLSRAVNHCMCGRMHCNQTSITLVNWRPMARSTAFLQDGRGR